MYDLVGKRTWFFAFSLIILIPGIIAIALGGLKPGIDFTGGTQWVLKVKDSSNTAAVSRIMSDNGHPEAVVQNASQKDTTTNTEVPAVQIRFKAIEQAEKFKLAKAFNDSGLLVGSLRASAAGDAPNPSVTGTPTATTTLTGTGSITGTGGITSTGNATNTGTVSNSGTTTGTLTGGAGASTSTPPSFNNAELSYQGVGGIIGSEITQNAILAIAIASIGILAYLWYAFRKVPSYGQGGIPQALRFGICAVVAMLHDVIVVLGVFAILGLLFNVEIDALFVTAMLTVVGFSVHDTIVVFDRVRENLARRIFPSYGQVVNHSLLQTLARSINTSLTVIFTLSALLLFGGGSIRNFVLALLIGIISGTYSSIFNASMLLVVWEEGWRPRRTPPTTAPLATTGKARTA